MTVCGSQLTLRRTREENHLSELGSESVIARSQKQYDSAGFLFGWLVLCFYPESLTFFAGLVNVKLKAVNRA